MDTLKEKFNAGLIGGIAGALLFLILFIVVVVWLKPFNYRAVMIVEQSQITKPDKPVITPPEAVLMTSLRDKGYLVTPAEYTNNMIEYYNTLIAFMAVFFVVFTIAGYFAIRSMSKKEVRDEARELLLDSESFRSDVLNTLTGNFDANYVPIDDFEQRMKDVEDNLASIIEDNGNKTATKSNRRSTVKKRVIKGEE